MNSNTSTPMVSIPSGVYDLESLKSECCLLGIPPSRPNIRRVRKALDIVERLADQAKYDQWLCEQYEADKAREDDLCFTYDPSVDPPIDFPID